MLGNIISINDWAEFYIGDSKMGGLATFLAENGLPENKEAKEFIKQEGIKVTTRNEPSNYVKRVQPEITIPKKICQNYQY